MLRLLALGIDQQCSIYKDLKMLLLLPLLGKLDIYYPSILYRVLHKSTI
jgi:hypothetical protein